MLRYVVMIFNFHYACAKSAELRFLYQFIFLLMTFYSLFTCVINFLAL